MNPYQTSSCYPPHDVMFQRPAKVEEGESYLENADRRSQQTSNQVPKQPVRAFLERWIQMVNEDSLMGDYTGYRIYAKVDKAFGELILEHIHDFWTYKVTLVPNPLEIPEGVHPIRALVEWMRMGSSYFEFEYDNLGNRINEELVGKFEDQVILHEDHAVLSVFFSTKAHRSFEPAYREIAQHLFLKEGESIAFAMEQFEYDCDQIVYWFCSRGVNGLVNITTETVKSDCRIVGCGFHTRLLQPFPTEWFHHYDGGDGFLLIEQKIPELKCLE